MEELGYHYLQTWMTPNSDNPTMGWCDVNVPAVGMALELERVKDEYPG